MKPYIYIRTLKHAEHTVFCVQEGQKAYFDPLFNRMVPYSSGQQIKRCILTTLTDDLNVPMAPITFNYNITKKDGLENKETWAPCDPRYIDQLIGGWMRAGKDMVALKRRSPLSVSAMRPIHPLLGGLERYISVIPTPQNTAVLDMSAEQYEAAMKLSLAAMGQDAEATVESVEKTEVDGYPTVKSVSQLTMSGATFYITDYQIVASQNYSITFADATADGAWADAFDQAAASIDLLKEGETATADFSDLAKYDLSCGLSLSAMDGLAEVETEEESGYDGYMESNDVLFFAVHDTKEELLEAGYSKLSLEQYGKLVSEAYELDAFSTDNLGNLYVTDTDTTDSGEIFYYFTVVQGTDGFWTCYFACYNDLMPYYVSAFSIWASSITAP